MARLAVATTALCAHALAPTPLRTRRTTVKMTATVAPPSLLPTTPWCATWQVRSFATPQSLAKSIMVYAGGL